MLNIRIAIRCVFLAPFAGIILCRLTGIFSASKKRSTPEIQAMSKNDYIANINCLTFFVTKSFCNNR